jgi:hypothetical protein
MAGCSSVSSQAQRVEKRSPNESREDTGVYKAREYTDGFGD